MAYFTIPFLIILVIRKITGQSTYCDNTGSCFIKEYGNETPIKIQIGYQPHRINKGVLPTLIPNTTIIMIDSHLVKYGYSKYGVLSGVMGYECSGGLNECVDSCCINGRCIELSYLCRNKANHINIIYIIGSTSFIIISVLYFFTYWLIGWKPHELTKIVPVEKQNTGISVRSPNKKAYDKIARASTHQFPYINEIITERNDESSTIGQTVLYHHYHDHHKNTKSEEIQINNNKEDYDDNTEKDNNKHFGKLQSMQHIMKTINEITEKSPHLQPSQSEQFTIQNQSDIIKG